MWINLPDLVAKLHWGIWFIPIPRAPEKGTLYLYLRGMNMTHCITGAAVPQRTGWATLCVIGRPILEGAQPVPPHFPAQSTTHWLSREMPRPVSTQKWLAVRGGMEGPTMVTEIGTVMMTMDPRVPHRFPVMPLVFVGGTVQRNYGTLLWRLSFFPVTSLSCFPEFMKLLKILMNE